MQSYSDQFFSGRVVCLNVLKVIVKIFSKSMHIYKFYNDFSGALAQALFQALHF